MTSVPGSSVCDPKPAKGAISSAPGILGLIRETLDVLKSYCRGGAGGGSFGANNCTVRAAGRDSFHDFVIPSMI